MAKGNGKKKCASCSGASNSRASANNSLQRRPKNPSSGIEFLFSLAPNIWLSTRRQVVFDVHGRRGMSNLSLSDNLPVLHQAIDLGRENHKHFILVIHGGNDGKGAWINYLKTTYPKQLKPWKRSNPGVSILYIGGLKKGCR